MYSSRVGCLDRVCGRGLNLLSSTIPPLSLSPSLPLQLLHGLRQIVNGLSLLLIPGRWQDFKHSYQRTSALYFNNLLITAFFGSDNDANIIPI